MAARWSMAAIPITEAQPGTVGTARTGITVTGATAQPPTMARTGLRQDTVATPQTGTITRAVHIRTHGVEGQHTQPTERTEPSTLGEVVIATPRVKPTTTGLRRRPLGVRPITAARIPASGMPEVQPLAASTGEAPLAAGGTTTAGLRERRVAVVGEVCTPVVSTAAVFCVSRAENHVFLVENRHVDCE